jgi:hypothetical protein
MAKKMCGIVSEIIQLPTKEQCIELGNLGLMAPTPIFNVEEESYFTQFYAWYLDTLNNEWLHGIVRTNDGILYSMTLESGETFPINLGSNLWFCPTLDQIIGALLCVGSSKDVAQILKSVLVTDKPLVHTVCQVLINRMKP